MGALRLPKNDLDASRPCEFFDASFGEGNCCGIAVKPGVLGSGSSSDGDKAGDLGAIVGLVEAWLESSVTGRMVAPLKNGEVEADRGDRGVSGLRASGLCNPGANEVDILLLLNSTLRDFRSRFGIVELRDGMLGFTEQVGPHPRLSKIFQKTTDADFRVAHPDGSRPNSIGSATRYPTSAKAVRQPEPWVRRT